MSFSSDARTEILSNIKSEKSRHCRAAQLLAVINVCGFVSTDNYHKFIAIHNENNEVLNLARCLIKDLFDAEVGLKDNEIIIRDSHSVDIVTKVLGLKDSNDFSLNSPINTAVIAKNCCKRAYIRTAFVCCGSVNDPSKRYHLEFADSDYDHAKGLVELVENFGIDMKIVERQKHFVVYCKEAEQIADLLNVMSAYKALLDFENLRVVKDVRNNINRIVNCETANINRVVSSSVKQIEDIQYIMNRKGLDFLSHNLRAVAEVRLKYPDGSLKELGEYLMPPLSKYGVNHRLKKIHEIAESLKGDYFNDQEKY